MKNNYLKFEIITPKQYMLETGIKMKFDQGKTLNKYSRTDAIKDQSLNSIELIMYYPSESEEGEEKINVYNKCNWRKDENGEYEDGTRQSNDSEEYNFYWCEEYFFFRKFTVEKGGDIELVTPKKVKKTVAEPKQIKKENFEMPLSTGTWILLIIVMVVVAKVAHKISLKTIFTPTKKTVKHIGKEWKDS